MHETGPRPPGFKWLLILAAAGFAAGFLGPMVFSPESNQGPLVGILITGPAGFLLGAALWLVCALFKPSAQFQWRALYTVAIVGVLATLLFVQPGPKLRGYVFEGSVLSCATPEQIEAEVLGDWEQRIAGVRSPPRAGWQSEMRRLLRAAPGAVISVSIRKKKAIEENRKPWNRGSQFAAGWSSDDSSTFFYDAIGTCEGYPAGSAIRGFQESDADERLNAADVWPPTELLYVLSASALAPTPAEWRKL